MNFYHKNKQDFWVIVIFIMGFISIYSFLQVAFIKTEVVCGKVTRASHSKSTYSLIYWYEYQGTVYEGSFSAQGSMCARADCYENRCVDIEVSTWLPWMSRLKEYPSKKEYHSDTSGGKLHFD